MPPSELGYFQQMSQSAWHQLHQAITNLCPPHFSVADREQLTILLIKQLSHSCDRRLLAFHYVSAGGFFSPAT